MSDEHTCGKGIAARSVVPRQLSAVLSQTAKVLAMHLTSLNPFDAESTPEYEAYTDLIGLHEDLAGKLSELADRMAASHDLPMAAHDMNVLTSAAAQEPFRQLVAEEEKLVALMQEIVEEERRMLEEK